MENERLKKLKISYTIQLNFNLYRKTQKIFTYCYSKILFSIDYQFIFAINSFNFVLNYDMSHKIKQKTQYNWKITQVKIDLQSYLAFTSNSFSADKFVRENYFFLFNFFVINSTNTFNNIQIFLSSKISLHHSLFRVSTVRIYSPRSAISSAKDLELGIVTFSPLFPLDMLSERFTWALLTTFVIRRAGNDK